MPQPGKFAKCFGVLYFELTFESRLGRVNQDFFGRTVQEVINPAAKFPALTATSTPKRSESTLIRT